MGVDTESSGYYTYFSELCLIQITTGQYNYIIDPLSDLKMDKLGDLFNNPAITKIFHSAPSDIQELKRRFEWDFNGIFDTFLACRMLGIESCSLAALVEKYCQVKMEKGEQKSNWKKRPLTSSQLKYAYLDTAYLERIMDAMVAELKDASLYEEYMEEVEWESRVTISPEKELDLDGWIRIPGAVNLEPAGRGQLKALYEVRDQIARRRNIASFRIISNKALVELVRLNISELEGLAGFKQINPAFIKSEGPRILKAIEQASAIDDIALPAIRDEMEPDLENRFVLLKKWRHSVARRRKMDPSVIMNNRILLEIARLQPASIEELRDSELISPGKLKRYGKEILEKLKTAQNN